MDPLNLEMDDSLITFIEKTAQEDFMNDEENMPFFYGQVDDDCDNDTFPKLICGDDAEEEYPEEQIFARCPHCGKLYPIEDNMVTDGEITICPKCAWDGPLYDFHLAEIPEEQKTGPLAIVDAVDGGYVLRVFIWTVSYNQRETDRYDTLYCEPQLMIYEIAREYCVNGEVYYYNNSPDTVVFDDDGSRFERIQKPSDDNLMAFIVNWDNYYNPMDDNMVDAILAENPYGASTFAELLQKKLDWHSLNLLQRYGFKALLEDFLYIPHELQGKNISEILRVDYNQLKARFDIPKFNMDMLFAARNLLKMGLQITDKNVRIMERLEESVVLKECKDKKRLFKYLRNQMERSKSPEVVRDYIDYLRDCKELNYDLSENSVRYPTDLGIIHRRMQLLRRVTNSPVTERKVRAVYDKLHSACEWSDGEYMVVMPTCCLDIVDEGAQQNQCVGNYCERVANGEDVILFLRKKDNPLKSFYTVEIRPNMRKLDIVQCRGYGNEDPSPEIRAAVDSVMEKYAQWFNTRPVPKGRTKMLRKYYKAVRKTQDGRYISHWDNETEYIVGEVFHIATNNDPDKVAVNGIHIASLDFAKNYGNDWTDVAILEIEVNMKDVVVPNAKDQVRTSKGRVLREVPFSELGEWGECHQKMRMSSVA